MADTELTNYKAGHDIHFGDSATTAADKGTGYYEEYPFSQKILFSRGKIVYIKADTNITITQNSQNTASQGGSRNKTVVGAGVGDIKFRVDKLWSDLRYDGPEAAGYAQDYSVPFNLNSLEYETGVPVVGTTGSNGGVLGVNQYYRGMVDSVGDEWHVLMVADDDTSIPNPGNADAQASDGMYILMVVNPKTPCCTFRATGDGEFYTTPAWTYWVPKIHDQTTYFNANTGTVTCELRDINGNNVFYRINGGSFTDAGAATVTLTAADFSVGSNTLEYYYAGNAAYTKTRTVVKNPSHVLDVDAEDLFGTGCWTTFAERIARPPYSNNLSDPINNIQGKSVYDSHGGTGIRVGATTPQWPTQSYPISEDAIMAHYLNFTGASALERAEYAKNGLMDSMLTQYTVGLELDPWSSVPLPCADTVYRGYWDVRPVYESCVAYAVLMDGYRSDQVAGGITPVEQYYIRDLLAYWVHLCKIKLGGF